MSERIKDCFVLVGELSGEEHAETFLPNLIEAHKNYRFWGVGGEQMKKWGVDVKYSLKDFSSMGFTDVIKKLIFYKKVRKEILAEIRIRNTDIAILVDFQGFNISIIKSLFEMKVKVLYFVAPQAWAWKSWRANLLRKYVEKLFCILPFEEKWFKDRGVQQAVSIAHPSYVRMQNIEIAKTNNQKYIVWLPGSRKGEIIIHWPIFLRASKLISQSYPEYKHLLIASPAFIEMNLDKKMSSDWVVYKSEQLFDGLGNATFAVAASGTVTLNCALMLVPTVVCYKVSIFNSWIFRSFIKYSGSVSLANLLLGKKVFPELLQEECHEKFIINSLVLWIEDETKALEIRNSLKILRNDQKQMKANCMKIMDAYFS